jgi:diacylglycerol kinase family enzyme
VQTGVHWTSDVVAGALVGAGVAALTRRWWPIRPALPARARPHTEAAELPAGDGLVVVANRSAGPDSLDPVAVIGRLLPRATIVPVEPGEDLAERLDEKLPGGKAAGVSGGDGSVAAAAAVAEKHGLPLAAFPGGTLNHFTRDVGVNTFDDVAESVTTGQAVAVDLASVRVDGEQRRPFVNTASIGGYPDLVRLRERWQHRLGKWLAAALALIRVLAAAQPLHVELDGRRRAIWLLFVGNGPYHPRGMVPAWRPALDTGVLDIRYLRADLPLSRTRFALGALTGALHRNRTYVQWERDSLRVRVLGDPVALATDGEVAVSGNRFDFGVDEARLAVYRPEPPK